MDRGNKILVIVFASLAAVFAAGILELFALELAAGDTYPAYSSFRSDPLGARAFYGALDSLAEVSAGRNLDEIDKLGAGADKTLFFLGSNTRPDPESAIEALESFISAGGRLVITLYPVSREPFFWWDLAEEMDQKKDHEQGEKSEKDKKSSEDVWKDKLVSIGDRWGFEYAYAERDGEDEYYHFEAMAEKRVENDGLPGSLSWHSALYFKELSEEWRVMYGWDDNAVIMERRFGKGSIALCSDSYFVSNEALLMERRAGLLAWLVGGSHEVIFDESHLGVVRQPGIMTLIRGYRLSGFLAALGLMAALFVWKNAASLAPHAAETEIATAESGRDVSAGLTNLLRRSVPVRQILFACYSEWRHSFGSDPRISADKREKIKTVVDREKRVPFGERDPARAYRAISKILSERN